MLQRIGAGNVSWTGKRLFGDVFDVLVKGEGPIKDDTKVMDAGGGENSGAVNGGEEIMGGFDESFGIDDDNF